MLKTPAVHALAIQIFCAIILLLLGSIMASTPYPLQFTYLTLALSQGLLAGLISRWRRLAWWWIVMQFLFPVALLATLGLHLPPALFLGVFLFLLLLYWTTFRTQVPFYPSGPAVWEAVAALLPASPAIRVIDIGSGLGGLVLDLSRRRPESVIEGIESAPMPWMISRVQALLGRSRAQFLLGNYEKLDFSEYDVVFCYLSPAAMDALWRKAKAEMRPGSLLISFEFSIPSQQSSLSIPIGNAGKNLYCWYF
jgi:SAM-dependent methyltransferase